ncbi:MAG TPA: hypothetical protein DC054_05650 [Blastocatellia bacterium]|nr:hypothetical protein [Blastocatellia bacterium]
MSNGKALEEPGDNSSPDLNTTPAQTSIDTAIKSSKKRGKKRGKKGRKKASKRSSRAQAERRSSPGSGGRPYPSATFESVLPLAKAIFDNAGASREMRRETAFQILGKAASSGPSRQLVITSGRYGLTVGGYNAETLRLSEDAVLILDPSTARAQALRAKFRLAIENVPVFKNLYERFRGGKLPAPEVMRDVLNDVESAERPECVDIFIGNVKYIGLLKTVSGAEWILDVDKALQEQGVPTGSGLNAVIGSPTASDESSHTTDFDSICFFLAPIGEEGEPERKHSDMVLETLLEHALIPSKLKVVRADKITQPGMISKQIIEYILKSKLVIADMSFHNPNAFYELGIRHILGKPIVHIIRKQDKIPFDLGNFRTIIIDDEDKYTLIAQLDTYRADISNYVREALEGSSPSDNPILTYFPGITVTLAE